MQHSARRRIRVEIVPVLLTALADVQHVAEFVPLDLFEFALLYCIQTGLLLCGFSHNAPFPHNDSKSSDQISDRLGESSIRLISAGGGAMAKVGATVCFRKMVLCCFLLD